MGKAELVLGAVLLSAVIAALAASHTGGEPDNWLFHYQTLITGLLALGSAIAAAVLLHQQIKQARLLEDERTRGQREAARSWLSLHISAILNYAETCGTTLWPLIRQCREGRLPDDTRVPEFPLIPMEAAIAVKEFAEFTTESEAKYLALMFSTMQVLDTRLRSLRLSRSACYLSNLESYLKDAAELYARAEALLSYARHNTKDFPPGVTWQRFSAALFFMTLSHEPTDTIARHIAEGSQGNLATFMPNRFDRDPE